MGWTIKTIVSDVRIDAHKVPQAFAAVRDTYETVASLEEAAWHVGFGDSAFADGAFYLGWYNDSAVEQDMFLDIIAPFVREGSHILWVNQDDELWMDVFANGKRFELDVEMLPRLPHSESVTPEDYAALSAVRGAMSR